MKLTGIEGRTALVTGAAGGIGSAVASCLAAAGATVVAADIDEGRAAALADSLREAGSTAHGLRMDVTDPADVERVVDTVERSVGPIGILVNAAGVLGRVAALTECEDAEWQRVFAVNAHGPFTCMRAVGRRMAERRDGRIITVGSNSAAIVKTGQGLYGASKAAAHYLTNCLGLELAGLGVRCLVVAPGTTETAMSRANWHLSGRREALLHGEPDSYRVGIPRGRFAQPEEIASIVAFLASDQAAHLTVTTVTVDGGTSLRP
ncbi:SDR family NAD(P)-dependent oxidoreductase [Streptomyces sp. NPDC048696]|uniref:SDR family NAD(P)-dependent oxidoreductase n=1 Tax=Streptomyces sp. NPDC048696 TaxID=3365585 RepID=UPI00371CC131